MCDVCLTEEVRVLVPGSKKKEQFTLRVGYGLGVGGVLIVGDQEAVASFKFEGTDGNRRARLVFRDGFNRFLRSYSKLNGIKPKDFEPLAQGLEAEALALYPRLPELMRKSAESWGFE